MHGQCVSHASVDLYRASRQVKLRDIPHEIECTGEHDRATDGGDERPWRPPGGLRKRIVERAHTPRLTKETECMPWQGHYHDSDEPQPELDPHRNRAPRLSAYELWPDLVGNCKIHDDYRAAKNKMEMCSDPGGVVNHRVHGV